jgi:hypothetical protein
MKLQTTESTQGEGGSLSVAGSFHCVITEVLEGLTKKGKAIDGITVTFEVLDGTVQGCAGKSHTESFFLPTSQDNDKNSAMKLRKLTAMAIAGGVMLPKQLGQEIDIPFAEMADRQIVVKFDHQMEMDGNGEYTIPSKYIQVSYSDLFHVDDPAVKAVPKNTEALSLIDKTFGRHPEGWFAWKKKKSAPPKRQAVGAVNGSDVDDIFG